MTIYSPVGLIAIVLYAFVVGLLFRRRVYYIALAFGLMYIAGAGGLVIAPAFFCGVEFLDIFYSLVSRRMSWRRRISS